ncbi:uncharacterized protein LOC110990838 isoform X2 [Acanthaster planci]|uniref:Uncharacterized protein LOC110990838 isoform X2 n=1 Tax=Acanthaster planci TaxID=133434 RepID=A0A8B8A1K3_ACAPL|nr:uncharacterized protein LOC110990838 isoform X2 [Acanthaster planci]
METRECRFPIEIAHNGFTFPPSTFQAVGLDLYVYIHVHVHSWIAVYVEALEKLTVTRLQRELTKTKSDNNLQRDAIMRDLAEERQSRLDAEKRLKDALLEGETYKTRLEALQQDLTKMQGMLNSVMEYKTKMEQMKEEHSATVQTLENDLKKCQTHISNLEQENSNLLSECHALETKVGQEEVMKEKTMLLERLRILEAENSALVLENENQREQYEKCLDEVANQVVQALLMQKDLKEECIKLHNRVRELEQQNRNLKCLFERDRQCCGPLSPIQGCFQHPFSNLMSLGPTSSLSTGQSQSLAPPSSNASPVLLRPSRIPDRGPRQEQLNSSEGLSSDSSHPASSCEPAQGSPVHGAKPVLYQLHGSPHSKSPQHRLPITQCHEHINTTYKETSPDSSYPLTNGGHPVDSLDLYPLHRTMPDTSLDLLSPQREQLMYSQNCETFAEYRRGQLSSRSNGHHHHHSSMISFNVAENDVNDGAGEVMGLEDLEWEHTLLSPASQRHLGEMGKPVRHLPNGLVTSPAKALALRNCYANSNAERKLGGGLGCSREAGRNGFSLGEQYTKPFVHAPFHYAQSLLQELKDISSSVKSFETLTLEPKSGVQQKRKASLEIQPPQSRQKVVRSQPGRPPDHIFTLSSSGQGSGYDAGPALARGNGDSSCSMTSSESIETMLERQTSITPFPDSKTENNQQGKQQYHEQHNPPSRDTDSNRVQYQETQAEQSSEALLKQYFQGLNGSVTSEKCQTNPESVNQLHQVQSSRIIADASSYSPQIERKRDACLSEPNRDNPAQQKTSVCRSLSENSSQSPTLQRNLCNATLAHRRDISNNGPKQEKSPTLNRNTLTPTHDSRYLKNNTMKHSQTLPDSYKIQRNLGSSLKSPQSPGSGRNAVAFSKQSGSINKTSQFPKPLTGGIDQSGSSPIPSGSWKVPVQPSTGGNQLSPHHRTKHSSGVWHSAQSPVLPNRHRNLTYPRPHRHLSEPSSRNAKGDQSCHTGAPHGIRPPNSFPVELTSPTVGKHRQSSSAPTSPSTECLTARMHQRNIARKMSPRVRKPETSQQKHRDKIPTLSGNEKKALQQTSNMSAGAPEPDVSGVSGDVRTQKSREDAPSRPSDLLLPSKEISNHKPSDTIQHRQNSEVDVSNSKAIPDNRDLITSEMQVPVANRSQTNPEENRRQHQDAENSTQSRDKFEEVLQAHDNRNERESYTEIENVIIAYSSQGDNQNNLPDSKLDEVLFNSSSNDASESATKQDEAQSVKALEEKMQQNNQKRPGPNYSRISEVGRKSHDNRVGSFMRATSLPVDSGDSCRPPNDATTKPSVTNIDELPIRGFNASLEAAITPKTSSQSDQTQYPDTRKEQETPNMRLPRSSGKPFTSTPCQQTNSAVTEGDCNNEGKSSGKLTAEKPDTDSTKRHSPFHIGTLGSSPRLPGRHQSAAVHLESQRRVVSDPACQHSLSYESLQSNQSEGSADWGSPVRNGATPKKPATPLVGLFLHPLSEILWSGSDSDDEEENVNFVEMWKARNSSPMKLPDWNPRKSVEDYKKKMQESLSSNSERPDSVTSSTSSEQWLLNYPLDKISPPTSLTRPSKTNGRKEPVRSSSVKNSESKTQEGKASLSSSKSAPATKTNGSLKRNAGVGKKTSGGDRIKSSGSDNSSLGENSMMADFVSSIMTEISAGEFGKSCISLDSGLKDKKKAPKMGISEQRINSNTRAKCNSLPSNHSQFLSLSIQSSPKSPQAPTKPVTKTLSASSGSKQIKSKFKETRRKSSLSGIPKAVTEKNFKLYKGQSSRKSDQQVKQQAEATTKEDPNDYNQVKKREPKGRSRIPKLIRNSFRSQKSENPGKKKTPKGSKKASLDDHKIQMTCNVPGEQSSNTEQGGAQSQAWMRRDVRRGRSPLEPRGSKDAKKSVESRLVSAEMPYIDDTGASPVKPLGCEKCNLCSNGEQISSDCSHAHQARKNTGTGEATHSDDHVNLSVNNVWKKNNQSNTDWNSPKSSLDAANQKLIHDIEQGHLCSDSECQLTSRTWAPQLNSNNKGSYERSLQTREPMEGGKEEMRTSGKQYKVPLVNEDMMEDFDVEELCDEESEDARENSAQLSEKERANLLDSLFESETDEEEEEGRESLDTSSDSHPDEKQFLKLLGGDRASGWKRQVVRPQATYCHVSILQLDLQALYTRFGDKEKEALSSFGFLKGEDFKLENTVTPMPAQINNNANNLQFALDEVAAPNQSQDQRLQVSAFSQPFDESLSVSDDVSCYSQSSSTPSLSLHD